MAGNTEVAIRAHKIGLLFGLAPNLASATPQMAASLTLTILGFPSARIGRQAIQTATAVDGAILSNLSFEIKRGTIVCLTGASGSGKTMLLRILSGALLPTSGRAEIYGRTSSLIDLGENLESSYTALQNIMQEQQYRGTLKEDGPKYADKVIEFAGLRGFEDVEVSRYSSGMQLRLSMAIALTANASVILLDDVLGVGDISFQQQCFERLRRMKDEGKTIVIALTDVNLIRQLADRVIELRGGEIVSDGHPDTLVSKVGGGNQIEWHKSQFLPEAGTIALKEFDVDLFSDKALKVDIKWQVKTAPLQVRPQIDVFCGNTLVFRSLYPQSIKYESPQLIHFSVTVPVGDFKNGDYRIDINVVGEFTGQIYSLKARDAIHLKVAFQEDDHAAMGDGYLAPSLPWTYEALQDDTVEH